MRPSKIHLLAPLFFLAASVAQAHPGHDGGDLVWEYSGGHIHLGGLVWAVLGIVAISAAYQYSKKQE